MILKLLSIHETLAKALSPEPYRNSVDSQFMRHSYCARFLYTIVPAELYWKDATLDKLNMAFAADLRMLYEQGITAPRFNIILMIDRIWHILTRILLKWVEVDSPLGPTKLHFAVVGVKGDWVYLRKVGTPCQVVCDHGMQQICVCVCMHVCACVFQAMALTTGWQCKRKCHLCSSKASGLNYDRARNPTKQAL